MYKHKYKKKFCEVETKSPIGTSFSINRKVIEKKKF